MKHRAQQFALPFDGQAIENPVTVAGLELHTLVERLISQGRRVVAMDRVGTAHWRVSHASAALTSPASQNAPRASVERLRAYPVGGAAGVRNLFGGGSRGS